MELKLACNLQCRLPFYNEMYSGCLLLHAGFSATINICQYIGPLRVIFDFQQIHSVLIRCKKVQKRMKSRAKIVNTAFALKYATPCKLVCKCDIYYLCLRFPPLLHFLAPYLPRENLCNLILRRKTKLQDKRE